MALSIPSPLIHPYLPGFWWAVGPRHGEFARKGLSCVGTSDNVVKDKELYIGTFQKHKPALLIKHQKG